jgi:hypothetical protein
LSSDATSAERRRDWVSYVRKLVDRSFFSLGGIFAISCCVERGGKKEGSSKVRDCMLEVSKGTEEDVDRVV